MTDDPIAALCTALDLATTTATGIGVDQWSAPTPCADWDVRALFAHLHDGNLACAAALGAPAHADDLAGSSDALVAAFSTDGALDRMVTLPFGEVPGAIALHLRTVEAIVHGWDLATATGQTFAAPDDLVAEELAFSQLALGMLPPGASPFAASVPVPDTAPALDQLVALLGRDPAWSAVAV